MKCAGVSVVCLVLVLGAGLAEAQSIVDVVKTGTPDQVRALAAKEPGIVNGKDKDGRTPLHHAAIAGSVPMIECLLSLGAVIDAGPSAGHTPLLEAVRSGKDAAAILLIDKGAMIKAVMHTAAAANRPAVIERLLANGADIEERDEGGFTPLMRAAQNGGPFEAMDLLVRKGANFNRPDSEGTTPLDNVVLDAGDIRTIDLLVARSAAVNAKPTELAYILSQLARRGQVRLFDYYIARGGEAVLHAESTRRDIMRSAETGGALEMVKALQARGVPLETGADRTGATPLHGLASSPSGLEMIEFLVANGADVNARTNDGRSAHNIAEAAGNHAATALLRKLGASPGPQQFPRLAGPYLGQTPPGDDLIPFAPGIVEVYHGTVSASPDSQEMYWPFANGIMTTRIQAGLWTKPAFAPFSGPSEVHTHDDVPFVTPDNKRLFFTSKRPVAPGGRPRETVWFVERTRDGWSEPRSVGPAVNSVFQHWQVSVSSAGTLCFGGSREKDGYGIGDIYCSRLVSGEYTEPFNLGPAVNTKDHETMPFIAPDESFILFFRAPGTVPSAYVSFKGRDGRWLPAVPLDIPWEAAGSAGLIVSPDGKYLFSAGRWKSTRFLEDLRRRVVGETTSPASPATEATAVPRAPGGIGAGEPGTPGGRAVERQEIARVVSSVIGWAKDKKIEVLFGAIARDDDYLSVSPGRGIVKAFEDVKRNVPLWMSPDFKYVRHELRDLEITFARSGDVAWFYCVLDDINTYKGQPASWENTRWTGVVEKRDGRWVVVQQHFSFANDR